MRKRTIGRSRLPLAAVLVLALAGPAAAQDREGEDRGSKLSVGISTGYINFGQFVNEETHHVRFGNTGKDLYFAVDFESRRPGAPVGFEARVLVAPTHYFAWPVSETSGEKISRWHWRPETGPEMWSSSAVWSCISVGARVHPTDWASVAAGPSLCSISGGSYTFGALPMHAAAGRINVRVLPRVAENMGVGLECEGNPMYIGDHRFSVLHEHAGEDPRTGRWALPVQCGFTVRVNP